MKPVMTAESNILNAFIESFVDSGIFNVHHTGKAIAYIGWYWRSVDFTRPFNLGRCKSFGSFLEAPADFVGFMENNKWDYAEITVTQKNYEVIVSRLRDLKNKYDETNQVDIDILKEIDQALQAQMAHFV